MTKYAHVKDGSVFKLFDLTAEEIALIPSHKQSYILPYITVSAPSFDPDTHHAPVRLSDDIQANQVIQVWAAPVAKTAGEIDAEKTAEATNIALSREAKIIKLLMTGQFFLINEIRALQSKSVIDVDQYFAALDGLPTMSDDKFRDRIKSLL